LIDLDPDASSADAADHVVRSLLSDDGEDQVAFRRGERYAVRVGRVDPPERRPFALRADASYLVTGGRSGVGLEVARWLAQSGARHLVLVSRTPVPAPETWSELPADDPHAGFIRTIREMEDLGARVYLPSVDVSDERAMRDLLTRYDASGAPRIRGVFHAASVWRGRNGRSLVVPIPAMELASIAEVFPPKVAGTWVLHRLLGSALDFLVLFSSGASIVGSAGQGIYAAANAFLDAFAHSMARQGGPRTLAINWGPITDAGFALTPEGRSLVALWERRGIGGIRPTQVFDTLQRTIPLDLPQLGVMKTDWARLTETYSELLAAPWASELAHVERRDEEDLSQRLRQTPPAERKEVLIDVLRQQVSLVMGLRPEDAPEPHRGLFELGMDSLLSLELKNRVQRAIRADFPATAVFDHPSIDALADYLLRDVLALAGTGPSAADERDDDDVLTLVERMSDDEVRSRLHASAHDAR
jgi:phthiocerol/phenolphthiocerol synthesis type-I polyketide synthase D